MVHLVVLVFPQDKQNSCFYHIFRTTENDIIVSPTAKGTLISLQLWVIFYPNHLLMKPVNKMHSLGVIFRTIKSFQELIVSAFQVSKIIFLKTLEIVS